MSYGVRIRDTFFSPVYCYLFVAWSPCVLFVCVCVCVIGAGHDL